MSTGSFSETLISLIKQPIRNRIISRYLRPSAADCQAQTTVQTNPTVSAAPTALSAFEICYRLPNLFPRSMSESIKDYEHQRSKGDELFQKELLTTLPFYPANDSSKRAEIIKTKVDDQGNYMNEFCVSPAASNVPAHDQKHLIFVHGYGAGLGFFLKNLENIPLLEDKWCIHALDLPGYGFSSRCHFPLHYPRDTLHDAQRWFHERLSTWFEKRGLLKDPRKNLVMAHSLGAYLMSTYVAKHPDHIRKLVMCSPAGICESTTAAKLGNVSPPWWFLKLWDSNISPFSLVRNSFHLGSKLTSGWSYKRFLKLLQEGTSLSAKQFEALHRYSYAIFSRPGCGEYLLSFALRCGGDPRVALEESLFGDPLSEIYKSNCEWLWLYGENDWMDVNGAKRITKKLNERFGEKKSRISIVPNSGHHLYLDNYNFFNKIMINEMKNM